MRKLHFIVGILFFIILLPASYPQSATERRGVRYYELYAYDESVSRLEQVTFKSTEVLRMLADGYFKLGRYEDSEMTYFDLMLRVDRNPEDLYQYAYVLAINGKHTESRRWMESYAKLVPGDSRVKRFFANPDFYEELKNDKGQFTIHHLNFNNEQSDFGAVFYGDRVVFASTRAISSPFRRLWSWNKLPFLNLYITNVDEEGQFVDIELFARDINRKFHDGPASFARDGTIMAFTRNNYEASSSDGVIKLNLYTARLMDNKWSEPETFPFNSNEYSIGHAAFTPDGRTIFFASDMPGGYGGVDIYVSYRDAAGLWSEPKNLGSTINTEGDEMFPFFHPDGYLFFASDGLPGLGGLDVFYSNVADINNPSEPINFGIPINSNADDFAFVLDKEMEKGYFSSNRATGRGEDDIYAFDMHFSLRKVIRGITLDAQQNVLPRVEVSLLDEQGNLLQTTTSTHNGAFQFNIDRSLKYSISGSLEHYLTGHKIVDATKGQTEIVANLELKRVPKFSLYSVITDAESGEPINGVSVRLVNQKTNQMTTVTTQGQGDFLHELIGVMMDDEISFSLTLEKQGYVTRSASFIQTIEHEGQINLHEELDLALRKIEVGADLGVLMGLKPIVFDTDQADIKPDAARELDKIVAEMNKYPDMEIELGAHTDCRGSAAYNLRLSINRAQSATWYIQARVSNPGRIYSMGYGQIRPLNNCVCEGGRAAQCSEEEHLQNRRIEFRILGLE